MKPSQINVLLITITFCLAFLGWGTIVVFRTVLDKNSNSSRNVVPPRTATLTRSAQRLLSN